jgi:glycosyltransferase involved in cell wall biosynthesis
VHVVVATVVHTPQDARIAARQLQALLHAGHRVTYVAPFGATDVRPPVGVEAVDVPRAVGRRRVGAVRAARDALRRLAGADLWLLHDPELLLAVAGLRRPPTVWDVHEDTAAALSLKPWLPRPLRPAVGAAVVLAERAAERRVHLLLAEPGYATRFRRPHPVVPNTTPVPAQVPPPGAERVVYVGHLSRARGALALVALAEQLRGQVAVEVVGAADGAVAPVVRRAAEDGTLTWHGPLPNGEALARVEGALAGLSLLADEPNYRHSLPTKVMEYMARGVPVLTTPTPLAKELVERHGCGLVVPFDDVAAVAGAVLRLRDDPELRRDMGARGHAAAREHHDWERDARAFVGQLEAWAG